MARAKGQDSASPAPVETLFRPGERALWQEYVANRERGLRKDALRVLDVLVGRLDAYSPVEKRALVGEICGSVLAGRPDLVQHPLVSRFVLPELARGYRVGEAGCARWLARLISGLKARLGDLEALLGRDGLSVEDLWRESLRVDPNDREAREGLIGWLVKGFDFYVHEVPGGVLAEPATFQRELDEFADVAIAHGVLDRYESRLRLWRSHSAAWADYRSRRGEFADYRDYLSRTHGTLDPK